MLLVQFSGSHRVRRPAASDRCSSCSCRAYCVCTAHANSANGKFAPTSKLPKGYGTRNDISAVYKFGQGSRRRSRSHTHAFSVAGWVDCLVQRHGCDSRFEGNVLAFADSVYRWVSQLALDHRSGSIPVRHGLCILSAASGAWPWVHAGAEQFHEPCST